MNKTRNEKGFMALTSVILITSTFVFLFVTMFFYATEEATRTLDRERVMQAYSLASSCTEIAMEELMDDFYYTGSIYSVGGESCDVSVDNFGLYGKTVMAAGDYQGEERKIQVYLDTEGWPNMEILIWQDVSDFETYE